MLRDVKKEVGGRSTIAGLPCSYRPWREKSGHCPAKHQLAGRPAAHEDPVWSLLCVLKSCQPENPAAARVLLLPAALDWPRPMPLRFLFSPCLLQQKAEAWQARERKPFSAHLNLERTPTPTDLSVIRSVPTCTVCRATRKRPGCRPHYAIVTVVILVWSTHA